MEPCGCGNGQLPPGWLLEMRGSAGNRDAMLKLDPVRIREVVGAALREDVGTGDVTSLACIPPEAEATAHLNCREPMVLAGIELAAEAFRLLSPNVQIEYRAQDGSRLVPGQTAMIVKGAARAILSAERVALNFVQRLSGVATLTRQYVDRVEGTKTRILDTRKTTPLWRDLEKYAVACGGGTNHRLGLWDQVLIKDNHLAALAGSSPNPIAAAVERARRLYPTLKVEVEADTLEQVGWAAESGADVVLLDNMNLADLRNAVALVAGRCRTEASGGVRLDTVRAIADTGVDFISVGALTHSARAVDLGLDFA
jgi:nicotinate-nucleotide pyrophosphorylase (carboxylating)